MKDKGMFKCPSCGSKKHEVIEKCLNCGVECVDEIDNSFLMEEQMELIKIIDDLYIIRSALGDYVEAKEKLTKLESKLCDKTEATNEYTEETYDLRDELIKFGDWLSTESSPIIFNMRDTVDEYMTLPKRTKE